MAGSDPPDPVAIGRYQVLRWLRDTSLAHVYLCDRAEPRGGRTDEPVELHVLSAQHHGRADAVAGFVRQARIATGFDHRGLPRVLEVAEVGVPYVVHAWVPGPTLHQLQTEKGWGRMLDLRMVARLVLDVASALDHAYRTPNVEGEPLEVVHGGLSPDRIVIVPAGYAHVVDFGTPAAPRYHAPEVIRGAPPSARADVYALGVILYALVTGQHAWAGTDANLRRRIDDLRSPRAVRADVPDEIDRIVLFCLEEEPGARPADPGVLAEMLSRWLYAHGGPVPDRALAEWGVDEAPSDGPRLVGSATFPLMTPDGPTRPRDLAMLERPTVPGPGAAQVGEVPTAPHLGPRPVVPMVRPLPPPPPEPDDRVRPGVALVVFGVVAVLGGLALAWVGPVVGLPSLEFDVSWLERLIQSL